MKIGVAPEEPTDTAIRELRQAAAPAVRALPAIGRALLSLARSIGGSGGGDPRGELVALNQGWGPVPPATLKRWARTGRLRAYALERGKLVAWERDIRAAVEIDRYGQETTRKDDATRDAFTCDPDIEAAE